MKRLSWLAKRALHDEWTYGNLTQSEVAGYRKGFDDGFRAAKEEAARHFEGMALNHIALGEVEAHDDCMKQAMRMRSLGDETHE